MKCLITNLSFLALLLIGGILTYKQHDFCIFIIAFSFVLYSMVYIISFFQDESRLQLFHNFFSMKKIYTEWGNFYLMIHDSHYYILLDNYTQFKIICKLSRSGSISYSYSKINSTDLSSRINFTIKYSDYLEEVNKEKIEKKKKRDREIEKKVSKLQTKNDEKEMKSILNKWSGCTTIQLERKFKISKIIK